MAHFNENYHLPLRKYSLPEEVRLGKNIPKIVFYYFVVIGHKLFLGRGAFYKRANLYEELLPFFCETSYWCSTRTTSSSSMYRLRESSRAALFPRAAPMTIESSVPATGGACSNHRPNGGGWYAVSLSSSSTKPFACHVGTCAVVTSRRSSGA
jgi:hypothetical protein